MGEPTIRTATEPDIDPVLRLWVAAGGQKTVTDSHSGLLTLLASDRDALLIAEQDGQVVGSLIAAWNGWRGSFYRLAVHPHQRRQGIATALLREGERRLRTRGAVRLTAIAVENDPPAVGFWRSAGYEQQRNRARFVHPAEG